MSQSPLISVIVPVYNTEKYLRKCLNSICGQTYRNLEIICVNDGSPDNSAAILEEYVARDERIKVLTQTNAGQGAARNLALQQAKGEWITGVDSDDYMELDTYEYASSAMADDTDIICFGTNIEWQNQPTEPHLISFFTDSYEGVHKTNADIIAKTNDTFWNKLWRKSLITQLNLTFPEGVWYEDSLFWRAAAPFARHIHFLPGKKANYVRHGSSIMSQVFKKNQRTLDRLRIAELLMEFYATHPIPTHLERVWLDSFLCSFECSLSDIPENLHPQVWDTMQRLAERYNIINRWPDRLICLKRHSWLVSLFVHHSGPNKSSYGIPGFRPLTIQFKKGEKIVRFLGIKISRKTC